MNKYTPTRFMLPSSHYDKAKADRAVRFIQCLKHTKGESYDKPFILLPWQEQIIRDLYGVVKEDGTRQFKQAIIYIAKKAGKYKGRKRIHIPNIGIYYEKYMHRETSKLAIAKELKISRNTLDRLFDEYLQDKC